MTTVPKFLTNTNDNAASITFGAAILAKMLNVVPWPSRHSIVIDQAGHQPQQRLVLRIKRATAEKRANLAVGNATARRRVWFMPNEYTVPIAA